LAGWSRPVSEERKEIWPEEGQGVGQSFEGTAMRNNPTASDVTLILNEKIRKE